MNRKTTSLIFLLGYIFTLNNCTINIESKIDSIMQLYNSGSVPGAAVMIVKDSKIKFIKTYGLANLDKNMPVKRYTNFRLASVTKEFTAMCILILIERNQLSYETTLDKIFPNFPDYGRKIKIKNLLQHTSGLIAYESLIPDSATIQVHDRDVLKMMMKVDSTYFEPGTQFRYSNTGYAVLAMIIEKISGIPFADFLKENIFKKLGMNNSIAYQKGISKINNRAFGYTKVDKHFEFTDQSITSAVLGDGGIYTSLDDMYKWDQALYTDKLVSYNTMKNAFSYGHLNDGEKINYGYGWRLDNYKAIERVYHPGSTMGFRNIYQRYPELKLSVLILTNRSEPSVTNFATEISDLFIN